MNTKIIIFLCLLINQFSVGQKTIIQKIKLKKYKVGILSEKINETSSLSFINNQLYTLNDSGNTPTLYEINTENGNIQKEISNSSWNNFDWEALTFDGDNYYIGDIGNNWGTRKDLKIYKTNLQNPEENSVISYYFPEQKEFVKKNRKNNWDAESLEYFDGELHIFTKEWESLDTHHYTISTTQSTENYPAKKLEKFHLGFLATDVSFYQNNLYIVGYTKKMKVFLYVFSKGKDGLFFQQEPKKYKLGSASKVGQIEGIAVNEKGIYISGEKLQFKIFNATQSLYFISHQDFLAVDSKK